MQMHLVEACRRLARIERDIDRDHGALLSLSPDEQGDEAVERRRPLGRVDAAGVTMAGGAVPKMKAARERGMARGGKGAGVASFGANHDRMHENKTRTNFGIVNHPKVKRRRVPQVPYRFLFVSGLSLR